MWPDYTSGGGGVITLSEAAFSNIFCFCIEEKTFRGKVLKPEGTDSSLDD